MDIQLALSDLGSFQKDSDLFVILGAIVGHQDRSLAAQTGFHGAGQLRAVRAEDSDLRTLLQSVGLQVNSHIAVQRNVSQSTVFRHAGRDVGTHLCQDPLYPAGNTGTDAAADGIALGIGDLIVQIVQLLLHICQSGHNSRHVHGSQNVALVYSVPVLHQHLGNFHTDRDRDILHVHLVQRTAAGDDGMDGSGGYIITQHIRCCGSEPLLHPMAQVEHQAHQNHSDDRNDNQHSADNLALTLFLVLAEGIEQRLRMLVLFTHGFPLLKGFFYKYHSSATVQKIS